MASPRVPCGIFISKKEKKKGEGERGGGWVSGWLGRTLNVESLPGHDCPTPAGRKGTRCPLTYHDDASEEQHSGCHVGQDPSAGAVHQRETAGVCIRIRDQILAPGGRVSVPAELEYVADGCGGGKAQVGEDARCVQQLPSEVLAPRDGHAGQVSGGSDRPDGAETARDGSRAGVTPGTGTGRLRDSDDHGQRANARSLSLSLSPSPSLSLSYTRTHTHARTHAHTQTHGQIRPWIAVVLVLSMASSTLSSPYRTPELCYGVITYTCAFAAGCRPQHGLEC